MLKGKLIELVKPELKHMPLLSKWRNNPENRKFYREFEEKSIEDQIYWYHEIMNKDNTWYHFCIRPIGEAKIIGIVMLNHIHWVNKTGEFGITIGDKEFQGKGYGSDALLTLLLYGFFELNLNRIWCEVYSNNPAIDLYKKIGFQEEGRLRSHIFKQNKYYDSFLLGMLKSEFQKKYSDLKK